MKRHSTLAVLTVGFLAVTFSSLRGAGTNPKEEAAIRKQIATITGPAARDAISTKDRVLFTTNAKRPVIGSETPELIGAASAENAVAGSQKLKIDVLRIVIAESADLAYEHSKQVREYDLKNGTHVAKPSGVLRVWQKEGGEWKVAAVFNFAYPTP